jgi:hypothetical protein
MLVVSQATAGAAVNAAVTATSDGSKRRYN